jgi:P21-Rho-binding domain
MEIGFPTDVQHVAHIGWDDQNANNPSWVNIPPVNLLIICSILIVNSNLYLPTKQENENE